MDTHNAGDEGGGIDELDHAEQTDGELTGGMILAARDQLLSDGLLFRLNDEGIARHFAKRFFQGNVWDLTLDELREVIEKLYGSPNDIPSDPEKVPEWVRKELLDFQYLPREKLAELYDWASKDLLAIETNIADCRRAIREAEKRSSRTDTEIYDIRFYKYYLQLNQNAKDEIVDVLAHRMHKKALNASYGATSMFSALYINVPWQFRWYPQNFKHSTFSPIRHAFGDLPVRIFRDFQRFFKERDKTQFDEYLKRYISETKPTEKIRRLIEEHHLLDARKSVLVPVLEAYERKKFALFASAAATQIEGIIEDGCLLSGISLHKLRLGSITTKLDELVRDTTVHIDYVYYAFKFPIIRNRIAHGGMLTGDLRDIHLLLLDLYDCCRVVRYHPGPHNALVELLRRISPNVPTLADVVEFAALYAETNCEPPNDFYGLAEEFEDFTLLLDKQVVLCFLHELLGSHHEALHIGLRFIGNRIKKTSPSSDNACTSILKNLGDKGQGEFDRGDFMAAVRGHPGYNFPILGMDELRSSLICVLRAREQWLRISDGTRG